MDNATRFLTSGFFSLISFPQAPEKICKGGQATVFLNPQILGLNPQSQIRKFLRYASPQISFH
jgi:hypothetical protein